MGREVLRSIRATSKINLDICRDRCGGTLRVTRRIPQFGRPIAAKTAAAIGAACQAGENHRVRSDSSDSG
jgi:hypothetical protein